MEWIKCSDRMPAPPGAYLKDWYLTFSEDEGIKIAPMGKTHFLQKSGGFYEDNNVVTTHWMPLPANPVN